MPMAMAYPVQSFVAEGRVASKRNDLWRFLPDNSCHSGACDVECAPFGMVPIFRTE